MPVDGNDRITLQRMAQWKLSLLRGLYSTEWTCLIQVDVY